MSHTIRSGWVRRAVSIPSGPSSAVNRMWPAARSRKCINSRWAGLSSMIRIREAISGILRQNESERAPRAEFALELDVAAEQVRQLLAEVQAQARPFVAAHARGTDLLKRPEQLGLVL